MSGDANERLSPCGCCEKASLEDLRENPPGQSALAYRIGTQPVLLERMLTRLHRERIDSGEHEGTCPLANVSARPTDDPMAALLDAWACVGDVLTFYQERLANEAYLRTATERRSVLELARTIGYELSPGVAASTYLAFTIEEPLDEDERARLTATIPEGTQVQSIPEQGKLPLTFETSEDFVARPGWNELRPYLTEPQILGVDSPEFRFLGIGLDLEPGDLLLVHLASPGTGAEFWLLRRALTALEIAESEETLVTVEAVAVLNAIIPDTLSVRPIEIPQSETVETALEFTTENLQELIVGRQLTESALAAILEKNRWDIHDVLAHVEEVVGEAQKPNAEVYVFRETVSFFGHNAPKYKTLPVEQRTEAYPESWDGDDTTDLPTIWETSQGDQHPSDGPHAFLERALEGIASGSYVLIEGYVEVESGDSGTDTEQRELERGLYRVDSTSDVTLADYGLSSKCTGLRLKPGLYDGPITADDEPDFLVRQTLAHLCSEKLDLAPTRPISGSSTRYNGIPFDSECATGDKTLSLQGVVTGLAVGQALALSGECKDPEGIAKTEIVTLGAEPVHDMANLTTLLEFSEETEFAYDRDSIALNANVVPATHGESVQETLGSGDGAEANQTFKLSKSPLTYTSAETASGAESTLEARVDGILWNESAYLHGAAPGDTGYMVRIDNDAAAHVTFGDGVEGARLPTGSSNVTARYRSGLGLAGELDAGRLTLLKTKPLGVREVTNPVSASGAEDPESLINARENAPLHVLTLDRVVSVQDYEDFTRTYAGIGKAQASVVWNGEREFVHITVASASGGEVNSETIEKLKAALDDARDPRERILIESFDSLRFRVAAKLRYDSAYLWDDVQTQVEQALNEAFSFAKRAFGQPVSAAEIAATIHAVDGVLAVDLDELRIYSKEEGPTGKPLDWILSAKRARYIRADRRIAPAQLLLIESSGIEITEVSS